MSIVNRGNLEIDGVEPGAVYVLSSEINCRFDGELELLHVISKYAGGEIRGYKRPRKSNALWTLRTPAYPLEYDVIDQATANLIGEQVNGFAPDTSARRSA